MAASIKIYGFETPSWATEMEAAVRTTLQREFDLARQVAIFSVASSSGNAGRNPERVLLAISGDRTTTGRVVSLLRAFMPDEIKGMGHNPPIPRERIVFEEQDATISAI